MKSKVIETEHFILRRYTLGDVKALHQILSCERNMAFWSRPFSLRETEDWLVRNVQRYAQSRQGRFAVCTREKGEVVGDAGVTSSLIDERWEVELGIILQHEYWNRGYGVEIGEALKQYGLTVLKLKRIVMSMPCHQAAAIKLASKLGFHREKLFVNERNRGLEYWVYSLTPESQ